MHFPSHPYEKKRTKSTFEQTPMKYQTMHNECPRWYLIQQLDKIWTQACIEPDDQSETVHLPEMTSVGARTQPHKEWLTHMRDRAPHTGALTNTEQQDTPHHHEMNHNPVHPEGNKGILQAVCIHMIHRTNTFSIFTLFHPNLLPHWCWQGICKMDTGTDLDTWQQASNFTYLLWLYKALILQ